MRRPVGHSELRGRRILVVEDEMLIAMELEAWLKDHGCEVAGPAPSVERALALLEKQRPDAAILDFNLNGRSALPVAAMLSEQNVPFVVLSGYSAALSQAELRTAPQLTKPVREIDLVRTLRQVLAPPQH